MSVDERARIQSLLSHVTCTCIRRYAAASSTPPWVSFVRQRCSSLPIGIGTIGIDERSFESIRRFERVDDRRIVRIGHSFEAMVLDDGQVIAFKVRSPAVTSPPSLATVKSEVNPRPRNPSTASAIVLYSPWSFTSSSSQATWFCQKHVAMGPLDSVT